MAFVTSDFRDRFVGAKASNAGRSSVMTDEEIRHYAPSIFATEAHESRSERFAFIPTFQVLDAMRREGFFPVKAVQGRSRTPGKAEYTKHLIRFRRAEDIENGDRLNIAVPETILVNAHDGTSRYKLMAGLFRKVCYNGLTIVDEEHGAVSVHHKGDVISKVIDGSYEVIEDSREAVRVAADWNTVPLLRDERLAMAEAAHVLRFGEEGSMAEAIRPERLLDIRRRDDNAQNLWVTHNVIQENVIQGGLTGRARNANNQNRRVTSRAITGIDQDVKLNAALHRLSERMAQIKRAA